MEGYIKLYRKLMDSPVWSDPHYLKIWMYCLMKASHKKREALVGNQVISLEPGQFITGRNSLANDLNKDMKPKQKQSEISWWRYLNNLAKWEMLNIKKTNKYSVISILNWCEYQQENDKSSFERTQNEFLEKEPKLNNKNNSTYIDNNEVDSVSNYGYEQQMNNKRTTNEQQLNTNKNVKNVKNVKNDKNKYSAEFEEFWNVYPRKIDKAKAFKSFKAKRKKNSKEDIVNGVKRYSAYLEKMNTESRFIKHGATFLNNDSFLDEYEIEKASQDKERESDSIPAPDEFLGM